MSTLAGNTTAKVATIHSCVDGPPSQPKEQHGLAGALPVTTDDQNLEHRRENEGIPFWNRNVPLAEHTAECPDYLTYAFENEKDRRILNTPDEEYQRQTWDEILKLIQNNRLDGFMRVPSELRLYRQYCHKLIQDYGSIMKFVLEQRLRWSDVGTFRNPFSSTDDYKILYNDWPYGVDEGVVHLVVWTKFELPADAASKIGDMTPETQKVVDDFVNKTFVSNCGKDNVIWFKNWQSLKSVHAIEHFHVMILNPDMEFVRTITNEDVPLFLKVKKAKEQGAA